MIKLFDKENNTLIGEISDEQMQFLVNHLEEQGTEDPDYFLSADTVDRLEEEGADDDLLLILRKAMGDRSEIDIRWEEE